MLMGFGSAALLAHLVVIAGAVALFRRPRVPLAALLPRLLAWGLLAALAAELGRSLSDPTRFTVLRLLAQFAFGELPVLLLVLAALRRERTLAVAATGVVAIYTYAYHVEPWRLQRREHVVETTHGPALRIVHVSDIQAAEIGPHEERAWRAIVDSDPDLVVLTGDYVQPRDGDDPAPTAEAFRRLMLRYPLRPRLGAYALPGDVEGRGWRQLFAGTTVRTLQDEAVDLDGGAVRLVGLSRPGSRAGDAAAVRDLLGPDRGELRIVAGHAPDFVDALAGRVRVDLVLAGHTHGGQVAVPGLGPLITLSRLPRRYAAGLEDYDGVPLHVTRGVGMERGTAPQLRFFCPPEVCLLRLQPRGVTSAAGAAGP